MQRADAGRQVSLLQARAATAANPCPARDTRRRRHRCQPLPRRERRMVQRNFGSRDGSTGPPRGPPKGAGVRAGGGRGHGLGLGGGGRGIGFGLGRGGATPTDTLARWVVASLLTHPT